MNTPSRREKIEAMLKDEPHDIFLRYSLAMELQKEGEHEASLRGFRELMSEDPPHVPAFFMASKLLVQLSRLEDAREVLRAGIEEARSQSNEHAASEMSELLMAIGGKAR
jgi:thioredoxin-like negative regulator of GroEL